MIIIGTHIEKGHKVFIPTNMMGGDAYFSCYACHYNKKIIIEFKSGDYGYYKNRFGIDPLDYSWQPEGYFSVEDCVNMLNEYAEGKIRELD